MSKDIPEDVKNYYKKVMIAWISGLVLSFSMSYMVGIWFPESSPWTGFVIGLATAVFIFVYIKTEKRKMKRGDWRRR